MKPEKKNIGNGRRLKREKGYSGGKKEERKGK